MTTREKLLQGPVPELPLKSIFEIGGIDREENVITKFYQFFLRNDKTHGLGTIFIDSLIAVAATKNIKIPGNWNNYLVRKEVHTKHKNRIDLLIEEVSGKEKKAIIIENKVNAPLKNDLEDYWNHLKKYDDDKKFAFLIHDKPITEPCKPFIKLTHAEWMREVSRRIEKAKLRGFFAVVALEMANLFDKTPDDKKLIEASDNFAIENYAEIEALKSADAKIEDITPEKALKIGSMIEMQESMEDRLYGGLKNSYQALELKDATCRRNVNWELTLKFSIDKFYFRLVFSIKSENKKTPLTVFADFLRPAGIDIKKFYRLRKNFENLKIADSFKSLGVFRNDPGKDTSYEIAQKQYTIKQLSAFGETGDRLFNLTKKDWMPIIQRIEKDINKLNIK